MSAYEFSAWVLWKCRQRFAPRSRAFVLRGAAAPIKEIAMATQTMAVMTSTQPRQRLPPLSANSPIRPRSPRRVRVDDVRLEHGQFRDHPGGHEAGRIGLAFAYGGIAQFAAGLWEFAKGTPSGHRVLLVRRFLALVLVADGQPTCPVRQRPRQGPRHLPARLGIFTAYMAVAATRSVGRSSPYSSS